MKVILGALFAVVGSFITSTSASAFSLDSLKGTFSHEPEVKAIQSVVSEKTATIDKQTNEVKEVENTKKSLVDKLSSLKEEVKALDSLFVHINRYAPDAMGNKYVPGNCTWYVKSMRPDIGNFWGNANTWFERAKAQGWNVGDKPKKGAVATSQEGFYGHVAYVTKVSKDQKFATITEMNYGALYRMNTRTVPASAFRYIYELN